MSLTDKQTQVYDYVRARIANGLAPTRSEISREFGWASANAAEDHLRALERKGLLKVLPGTARGIVLHDSTNADWSPRTSLRAALAEWDRWRSDFTAPPRVPFDEVLTHRAAALDNLISAVRQAVAS